MAIQTIKLKIQEEADLYSPFDPDQEMISEDVTDYLLNSFRSKRKSKKDDCRILIRSDSPIDKDNLKEKFSNHFLWKINEINRSLRELSFKAICLAVFGIIVLSLMFYLSTKTDSMLIEILDIISWVAIWEATTVIVIETHGYKRDKKDYKKLMDAEITVS